MIAHEVLSRLVQSSGNIPSRQLIQVEGEQETCVKISLCIQEDSKKEYMVYFNYLDEKDWGKRILAKLTHDLEADNRHNEMLYHSVAPGTAVNLRRKRGEHHETGISADGDLQPPYACKGLQNYRLAVAAAPVRRICGRAGYAGRRTGAAGAQAAAPGTGRQMLCRAAGLQHRATETFLPRTGATGSKKGWTMQKL